MINLFPVVYASAINGTSSLSDDPADQEKTIAQSLIPLSTTFQLQLTQLWIGHFNSKCLFMTAMTLLVIGIGRVFRGTVRSETKDSLSKWMGTTKTPCYKTLWFLWFGTSWNQAKAGDLIAVSGMEDIFVGNNHSNRCSWSSSSSSHRPTYSSNDLLG